MEIIKHIDKVFTFIFLVLFIEVNKKKLNRKNTLMWYTFDTSMPPVEAPFPVREDTKKISRAIIKSNRIENFLLFSRNFIIYI